MQSSNIRGLQDKRRFKGEREAVWLVGWLNDDTNALGGDFCKMLRTMEAWGPRPTGRMRWRLQRPSVQDEQLVHLLKVFSQVRIMPVPLGKGKWRFEWKYARHPNSGRAIECIVSLSQRGLIDSVRKCEHCDKWLFAKFARQRFCSNECREKNFRSSATGRERRRKYMQGYRARIDRQNKALEEFNRQKGR